MGFSVKVLMPLMCYGYLTLQAVQINIRNEWKVKSTIG